MVKKEFELAKNTAEQLAASRQLDAAQWFDARRIVSLACCITSGRTCCCRSNIKNANAVSTRTESTILWQTISGTWNSTSGHDIQ